jgi:hypothetical protein
MADGYKVSAVAKATGIPIEVLTRDLDRKLIKIAEPKPGKGRPRLAGLTTIYVIAIGHALTKVFIPPTNAMDLAELFVKPQRGRDLGRPFGSGKTILLITDGVGSIINLQADQDISLHLSGATIVVDIGEIISTVNSRLIH